MFVQLAQSCSELNLPSRISPCISTISGSLPQRQIELYRLFVHQRLQDGCKKGNLKLQPVLYP